MNHTIRFSGPTFGIGDVIEQFLNSLWTFDVVRHWSSRRQRVASHGDLEFVDNEMFEKVPFGMNLKTIKNALQSHERSRGR